MFTFCTYAMDFNSFELLMNDLSTNQNQAHAQWCFLKYQAINDCTHQLPML
jgi:hypothetical protein